MEVIIWFHSDQCRQALNMCLILLSISWMDTPPDGLCSWLHLRTTGILMTAARWSCPVLIQNRPTLIAVGSDIVWLISFCLMLSQDVALFSYLWSCLLGTSRLYVGRILSWKVCQLSHCHWHPLKLDLPTIFNKFMGSSLYSMILGHSMPLLDVTLWKAGWELTKKTTILGFYGFHIVATSSSCIPLLQ